MALVSLITVSHNYGRYLPDCFASVEAQTFRDFEHILVDANSSDNTKLLMMQYWDAAEYPVRLLRVEEFGLCKPKNRAVEEANGQYIVNLDADDKLHPKFLERMITLAGTKTIVCPGLQEFNGGTNSGWPAGHVAYEDFQNGNRIFCASMFPRDEFLAVGGYDENLDACGYEDWCLWLDLLKHGCTVKVMPEILFYYRGNAAVGNDNSRRTAHLADWRERYIREKHK